MERSGWVWSLLLLFSIRLRVCTTSVGYRLLDMAMHAALQKNAAHTAYNLSCGTKTCIVKLGECRFLAS